MFFEYHSEETGDATEVTTAGKNDPSFFTVILLLHNYLQLRKLILMASFFRDLCIGCTCVHSL